MREGSIKDVVKHVERRELVIFAGAGISIARPSSLVGFLDLQNEVLWALHRQLAAHLSRHYRDVYGEIRSKQLEGTVSTKASNVPPEYVMELCKRELECTTDDRRHFALEPILTFSKAVPNANHIALAGLLYTKQVRAVFTTNFDTLIEQAYALLRPSDSKRVLKVYKTLEDFSSARGFPRGLYKLHGCITEPNSIVTSLDDVGRRAVQQKYNSFKTALKRYVVLFIGYRGADLDIFGSLATSACRRIIWNTLSRDRIIDKMVALLRQKPSVILEMDLCEVLTELWPGTDHSYLEAPSGWDAEQDVSSLLAHWAEHADRNSIRLILGDFWDYIGERDIARKFYRSGRISAARKQDVALRNTFVAREAGLLYGLGHLREARRLCLICLQAAETLPPALRLYEFVTSLQLLALIEARHNPKQAIDLFIQIHEYQDMLQKIAPDLAYRKAILLLNAGNALYRVGFSEHALGFYREALKIFDEKGDVLGRARTLNNMGNIYRDKGRITESIQLYRDSMYLLRETSAIAELPGVYLNLACLYSQQGTYDEVNEFANLAKGCFKLIGNEEGCLKAQELTEI